VLILPVNIKNILFLHQFNKFKKMKFIKILLLSMFTLTMAAQTVAKKAPLTDQELKRWSHLD
jgi:uncharacterized membrane protein